MVLYTCKSLGFEEKQREQNENEYVEEMAEDEYDALPEEEKQRIDQKRLQRKKDRIMKYEEQPVRFFDGSLITFVFLENNEIRKKRCDWNRNVCC